MGCPNFSGIDRYKNWIVRYHSGYGFATRDRLSWLKMTAMNCV